MAGIIALVAALMLTENSTILVVLGVVSAAGVVIVMTMIMTVMVVTVLQTFQLYTSWRELSSLAGRFDACHQLNRLH